MPPKGAPPAEPAVLHSGVVDGDIVNAAEWLLDAVAAQPDLDLLHHAEPVLGSLAAVLASEVNRELEVWWSRSMGLLRPPTYRELGEQYGVSVVRVQQIEAGAGARASRLLQRLAGGLVGVAAAHAARALGPLFPADLLRWPAVGLEPDTMHAPADLREGLGQAQMGLLLLRLAGPYRLHNRWLNREGGPAIDEVRSEILATGQQPYPTIAEAESALQARGIVPEARRRLIEEIDGLKVLDGRVCPWPTDAAGRAEVVLRVRGRPMPRAEIARIVGRGLGTVANGLATSERFVRVDADEYGLAEWPGQRYEGVVEAMRDAIRRRGGVAARQQILDDVLGRFRVAENSIRAYLASNQFVRVGRGHYRIREAAEVARLSGGVSLEGNASCFLLEDGWALRLDINEDRLRGSGLGITQAFARHLGLQPQGLRVLQVVDAGRGRCLGQVRFTWPTQMPAIGSVAHLIGSLGLQMGDLLFLAWDSKAGVLRARSTRPHGAGALTEQAVQRRIGALIGRPFPPGASSADLLRSLGESLGLGAEAGRMRVLSRLRGRGDEELLDLSRILYDLAALRLGI